jgi:hypothetical protein
MISRSAALMSAMILVLIMGFRDQGGAVIGALAEEALIQ